MELGLSLFAIGYFVEILILMQNRTYAGIRFYVSAYAVDTNIAKQTSVLFIFWERKNHGKKGIINKTISE